MTWRLQAACRPVDWRHPNTKLFFTGRRSTNAKALEVCDGCPVHEECLEFTMAHEAISGDRFGVAGRHTAASRTRLALSDPRFAIPSPEPTQLEVVVICNEMEADLAGEADTEGVREWPPQEDADSSVSLPG